MARRVSSSAVSCLVVLVLLAGCASQQRQADTRSISLSDGDGNELKLALSAATARSLVEDALGCELECDGDLDKGTEAMLRALDRRGPGASYTLRDGDNVIRARRSGRSLRLNIESSGDGGEILIKMPWAVGECLLGRSTTLDQALDTRGGRSPITVTIKGEDGGTFTVAVR